MIDLKIFGQRLQAARHAAGNYSKRQFAMMAHVDPSQYSKAEEGIKGLGADKIEELCSKWNINKDWLLTGKGGMFTEEIDHPKPQSISKHSHSERFLSGEISLTAQEYVNELKKDKARLEKALEDNQRIIDTNLTAMMTLLSALHRHDLSFHEVMLESLARLESHAKAEKLKNPRELIEEAHIRDHARMVEESLKDKLTAVDK